MGCFFPAQSLVGILFHCKHPRISHMWKIYVSNAVIYFDLLVSHFADKIAHVNHDLDSSLIVPVDVPSASVGPVAMDSFYLVRLRMWTRFSAM